jgi:hypothetical protein
LNGRVRIAPVGDVQLRFKLDGGLFRVGLGLGLSERLHLVVRDVVHRCIRRSERGDRDEEEGTQVHRCCDETRGGLALRKIVK